MPIIGLLTLQKEHCLPQPYNKQEIQDLTLSYTNTISLVLKQFSDMPHWPNTGLIPRS